MKTKRNILNIPAETAEDVVSALSPDEKLLLKKIIRNGRWEETEAEFLCDNGRKTCRAYRYDVRSAENAARPDSRKRNAALRRIRRRLCPADGGRTGRHISFTNEPDTLLIRNGWHEAFEEWAGQDPGKDPAEETRRLLDSPALREERFDDGQTAQIELGFRNGLSPRQIMIYANPAFDHNQMEQIRHGFRDGQTMRQVRLYADHRLDWLQMREAKRGFRNGLTMEQVRLYTNPKFDPGQMYEIRTGFENGLTIEQVKVYADPKYDADQMWQMHRGFARGLTEDEVRSYADPELGSDRMYAAGTDLLRGKNRPAEEEDGPPTALMTIAE